MWTHCIIIIILNSVQVRLNQTDWESIKVCEFTKSETAFTLSYFFFSLLENVMKEEERFGKNAHQERLLGFWAGPFCPQRATEVFLFYVVAFVHRQHFNLTVSFLGLSLNKQPVNKKLLLAMISGNTRCFSFQAHSFFHLFYGNMVFFFYNPTETHISVQRSLEEGHKISLSVLQQPCQAESNFQIIQADTTLETSIVYGLNGYLASVHFFPKLLQGPDPNKVW